MRGWRSCRRQAPRWWPADGQPPRFPGFGPRPRRGRPGVAGAGRRPLRSRARPAAAPGRPGPAAVRRAAHRAAWAGAGPNASVRCRIRPRRQHLPAPLDDQAGGGRRRDAAGRGRRWRWTIRWRHSCPNSPRSPYWARGHGRARRRGRCRSAICSATAAAWSTAGATAASRRCTARRGCWPARGCTTRGSAAWPVSQHAWPRCRSSFSRARTGPTGTYGLDIAGLVIERASGQRLGDFLRRRLFAPLGMDSTEFFVAEGQAARLATLYTRGSHGLEPVADGSERLHLSPPVADSGSGGLVSTLDDYGRFADMLANGGRHQGARVMDPATVRCMLATWQPQAPLPRRAAALRKLRTRQRGPGARWHRPARQPRRPGLGGRIRLGRRRRHRLLVRAGAGPVGHRHDPADPRPRDQRPRQPAPPGLPVPGGRHPCRSTPRKAETLRGMLAATRKAGAFRRPLRSLDRCAHRAAISTGNAPPCTALPPPRRCSRPGPC